ncbi:MAG: IS110 family transposase [Bacteroidota bacterium]
MKKKSKPSVSFALVNPHAAAIDIGSRSNWVCVGETKEQVREFGVFTEDHHELAKWLQIHKVRTVAMESTGIYWKPLFLILQAYGFEVLLVNASHVKNVRGKKTDMADCHWIWQLHRAGLLQGSFQPDEFTEELRTYNRHRQSLVEGAARCVSRMQKALVLMNLQLPIVLSDITGKSGKAIIRAILDGQRDGKQLAALADHRVRASKEEIAKALTGQWHEQYLFTLQQAWELYNFQWEQIKQCDQKIDSLLKAKTEQTGQRELVYSPEKKSNVKKTPLL